jgi:glycosyltransferase involved in cell wall biosynthesis
LNIAVNTRLLIKNKLEGIGWFSFETLKRITTNHPEHTFYFIFDRPFDKQFIFGDNVKPIVIGPPTRHPVLYYLWFEFSIPKILKEINADLFISPDGFLSLKTKIKSIAVIHDINFMHYPKDFPFLLRLYYRYFFPKFAKKANRIVTVSEYSKKDIVEQFSINEKNIDVVYNGSNSIYEPISDAEKELTKKKYTSGNNYFLFVGALSPRKNVSNLLLAFNDFKIKTQSKNKLVIVGEKMFKTRHLSQIFENLQFKDDVIFTGRMLPENLKNLYSASIALTFVPYFEGFGIPIIEAMNCETAVITSNKTSMPEVSGDAAILVNPFSVESISDAMIELQDNTELRSKLIEKGNQQKQEFSWDKTASKFWKTIEKVIHESEK